MIPPPLPRRARRTSPASLPTTIYLQCDQLPETSPSHGEIYAASTVPLFRPSSASAVSTVSEAVAHLQISEEVFESARSPLLKWNRITLWDLDLVDRAPSSSLSESSCSAMKALNRSSAVSGWFAVVLG